MRKRLIDLELWSESERGNPETDIEGAWRVLARLGHPCRHAGCGGDGRVECLVSEAKSGRALAVGRGRCLPQAICRAAIDAKMAPGKSSRRHEARSSAAGGRQGE